MPGFATYARVAGHVEGKFTFPVTALTRTWPLKSQFRKSISIYGNDLRAPKPLTIPDDSSSLICLKRSIMAAIQLMSLQ
jgi:hypothetical protein